MKKNNIKIKDNITMSDKINAIESIADSYFTYDEKTDTVEYTPYYSEVAMIGAITMYFIEGIEFEEDENSFDSVMNDEEIRELVNKFFFNVEETVKAENENKENHEYILLFDEIQNKVRDVVKFRREKLIRKNEELEAYMKKNVEMFEAFEDFFVTIANSLRNIANLDLKKLTPEMVEFGQKMAAQFKDKEITPDALSDVIKNAVAFDMDKASADIIDAKNEEIRKLKEENAKMKQKENARNVLAYPTEKK